MLFICKLPVQVCRKVRCWNCVLKRHPLITLDIISQKISAVTLGPLTVLGVVVCVAAIHQHEAMVDYSTMQVPAKSKVEVSGKSGHKMSPCTGAGCPKFPFMF